MKQEQNEFGGYFKLFPEVEEPEVAEFLDGSARIALNIAPRFTKYIFIEKNPFKAAELEKLKGGFPDKSADIIIQTTEANCYLQSICRKNWVCRRAVLFIDPFGMQLTWETLKAVAKTEAIDTWILFPVSAVNRLLKKDGNIPEGWRRRLDTMFGEPDWFDVFFPEEKAHFLGDNVSIRRKNASMERIGEYFNKRLKTVFADVASNPYTLRNTRGAPLFLLCFAAANPRAANTAIKIARDILKRDPVTTPMLPLSE